MPIVRPYPIGEVAPQPISNAQPSVPAAGEIALFGGNQARDLQVAGASLDKVSDIVATMALRQQALQDEADAKAADAGLANDVRTLLLDPDKGYYAKRGKEAIDAAPVVLQALGGLKQKYIASLKTDTSRRLFGDVADRRITGLQTQIGEKVISERRTYSNQASAARVQNFVDDAGVNYSNQNQVEQAIAGARSEILGQAEVNHEPPEETQRKLRMVESKMFSDVVKRSAEEDPYKAKAIRDANASRINSADGMELDKLLKEQLLRRGSRDNADAIRSGESADGKLDNNIGNITRSGFRYAGGKGMPQGAFETFTTPEHGVAAAYQLVQAKARANGGSISFVELIGGNDKVKGWAPKDDGKDPMLKGNDPNSYAARLAKAVGLKATDNVPLGDDSKMVTVLAQMNRHEKGKLSVPESSFAVGIQLARSGAPASTTKPDVDSKTGKPTLQWQLSEAERIKDQDMRDATMHRLRLLHGQDEAVVNEARRKAGEDVMGLVMNGKLTDRGQIPIDKWVALDPVQQRDMQSLVEANARGADLPANPLLYAELMRQVVHDPEAFKKRDLVPLIAQLPLTHGKTFRDLQNGMRESEITQSEKQVSMSRALRLSDSMLRSAGIYLRYTDGKGKVTNAKSFDDFKAQFQAALDQEISRFRAENGKQPDDGELTKMADQLLLQGRLRDTGLVGDERTVAFLRGKGENAPDFYVRYIDIPAATRQAIEQKLKSRGRPAGWTEVERVFTGMRIRGEKVE